jgi:hypothetical protein
MNRMVEVSIYDFLGFQKEQMVTDTLMTLNLDLVTGQEFLVKLVLSIHYTKIIKTIKITTPLKILIMKKITLLFILFFCFTRKPKG